MKLNDLELLVVSMRAQSGPSANPDVTFFKHRVAGDPPASDKEAHQFIEFTLLPIEHVSQHVARVELGCVRAKTGDFSLPLEVVDFYK